MESPAKAEPCARCEQPTRLFWLEESGTLSAWCNFCVAAQVLSYVGAGACRGLVTTFSRALDSERPEDVRAVSTALRALATLLRDRDVPPDTPG